jgi:hypothetical protein
MSPLSGAHEIVDDDDVCEAGFVYGDGSVVETTVARFDAKR